MSVAVAHLRFTNEHSSRERVACRICGAWRDKKDMQILRLKPH